MPNVDPEPGAIIGKTTYGGRPTDVKAAPIPNYHYLEYTEELDGDYSAGRTEEHKPQTNRKGRTKGRMSEVRVRNARQQGQLNFGNEVRQMLHAYGDPTPHPDFPQEPNPETVRVLDEMVTDFIIETCHAAARVASHAGRQKVKAEDFHFALRHDPAKLGRVQELFRLERELKEARKAFNENDDKIAGLKEMEKQNLEKAGEKGKEDASAKGKKAKSKTGAGVKKPATRR